MQSASTAQGGGSAIVRIARMNTVPCPPKREYYKFYHINRASFGAKRDAVQMTDELARTVARQLTAKHPDQRFFFVLGDERGAPLLETLP